MFGEGPYDLDVTAEYLDPSEATRPPSVDALARSMEHLGLPHPLLVDAAREAIANGDHQSAPQRALHVARTLLGPVINATGVLLHTNLGRAPVAHEQPAGYSNLELDLETGKRGSRQSHVSHLLAKAVGAESAIVVNNGAAAVLLTLAALGDGGGVAVSRGELVEIGGGFRIPDVMAWSGADLVEVGTTNRTRIADYERAVQDHPNINLILQVHRSNYRIEGFTESASTTQLGQLGPPLVADIGSGLLDSACPWLPKGPPKWLVDEPAARQTLAAGADLVIFSGDKLFGGAQAGIIAGTADLVQRCSSHPLSRTVRPGDMLLASIQNTALAYLSRDLDRLPFWKMATLEIDELTQRANAMGVGTPTPMASTPGGGTLPGIEIESFGIRVDGDCSKGLRNRQRPIIARVQDDATWIDLRTVDPTHDAEIAAALRDASNDTGPN